MDISLPAACVLYGGDVGGMLDAEEYGGLSLVACFQRPLQYLL